MAVLSDITSRVLNLLGSDANLPTTEAESIVQTRYEDLYEAYHWERRRRDFTLSLVAQVESTSTTLVTVTEGDATVTSAGTPFTSGMAGRQIQIGDELQYFFVRTFTDTANLELGDGENNELVWPRATSTSSSWRIFQTLYTLPSTADEVLTLSSGNFLLGEGFQNGGGRPELDRLDPDRSDTNSEPTNWFYAGEDSSNVPEVEVWPVPTAAILLRGQYVRKAPTLAASTNIDLPVPLLVYGSIADCANMLFNKQGVTESDHWKHVSLMYERKLREVLETYTMINQSKLNLPTSLSFRRSGIARLATTDYAVSHQVELIP